MVTWWRYQEHPSRVSWRIPLFFRGIARQTAEGGSRDESRVISIVTLRVPSGRRRRRRLSPGCNVAGARVFIRYSSQLNAWPLGVFCRSYSAPNPPVSYQLKYPTSSSIHYIITH